MLLHCVFFQAEDGIRDYKVTGVQTCALPISRWSRAWASWSPSSSSSRLWPRPISEWAPDARRQGPRSEERRVGKEGKCDEGEGDWRRGEKTVDMGRSSKRGTEEVAEG